MVTIIRPHQEHTPEKKDPIWISLEFLASSVAGATFLSLLILFYTPYFAVKCSLKFLVGRIKDRLHREHD